MSDAKNAEFSDLLREDAASIRLPGSAPAPRVRDESIYAEAERDPEGVLGRIRERTGVVDAVDAVLDWQPPHAKWFVGGRLNASVNCVDRHVRGAAPEQGGASSGKASRATGAR